MFWVLKSPRGLLSLSAGTLPGAPPLLLTFLTSFIIFWLIIESTKNHPLAVLSAERCVFWIPTTAGIFCGFQSNWTALVLWLLFLALMLRSTKLSHGQAVYLVWQALIPTGILLIHPWTWGVFVVTLVIFEVVLFLERSPSLDVSAMSLFSSLALEALCVLAVVQGRSWRTFSRQEGAGGTPHNSFLPAGSLYCRTWILQVRLEVCL